MRKKILVKNLVINAPNIDEGGPLTVLNEAVSSALKNFPKTNIYIITKNKKLVELYKNKHLQILEYPESKKSWISRLNHEFFIFNKLSASLNPDIWISLQDITSIVHAKYQAVYCHCPISFYQLSLKDIYLEPSSFVRNLLYNIVYRINIKKNDAVIVQQEWLRNKFRKITGHKKIIVAKPLVKTNLSKIKTKKQNNDKNNIFIYPALPRFQKNIELICEAVKLIKKREVPKFQIKITISGEENRYAIFLKRKYSNLKEIKFIGLQSREKMHKLYSEADALIFPSKLETWGLPISEAISYKLPIMISNLDYSRETLGDYERVSFFDYNDSIELSRQIISFLNQDWKPQKYRKIKQKNPKAQNWDELWKFIKTDFKLKNEKNKK